MAGTTPREPAIDAVRGLALLGMLMANLPFFAMPDGFAGSWWRTAFPGPADLAAAFAVRAAFESKFILIFSFLFGYGAARQLRSAGPGWFRWRLTVLGGIGIAHAVLLWPGDILLAYALIGLMLPMAAGWPLRRLVQAGLFCWALAVIGNAAVGVGLAMIRPPAADPAAALALVRSGDLAALLEVRLLSWAEFYAFGLAVLFPLIAGAFLAGVAIGRWLDGRPLISVAPAAMAFARLIRWPAVMGSLAYGVLAVAPKSWADGALVAPEIVLRALFSPLLAAVIFALALHVFAACRWPRLMAPLQSSGRLSLSVYVAQSLVCVLLFHGHGLGLYGRIGPLGCVAAALTLFALLTLTAEAWSRRFDRGPLETLAARLIGPRHAALPRQPAPGWEEAGR